MNRRQFLTSTTAILASSAWFGPALAEGSPFRTKYFPVPPGTGLHDTAPAPDGTIWCTGQGSGVLGRLDPRDGSFKTISLGKGGAPHGVTIGPDGAPWITEGGQNAIARVEPADHKVTLFPLPEKYAYANLNTGVFDKAGTYWFTGQSGVYGRLEPKSGQMTVFKAPKGVGPYGITVTPAAMSGSPRSPAATSQRSTSPAGMRPSYSRPPPTKARGGSGRTPEDGSGSASGTAAMSQCTIPPTVPGRAGSCRATIRTLTLFMSMRRTRSGSRTSQPMRLCASIPQARSSTVSQATMRTPMSGS